MTRSAPPPRSLLSRGGAHARATVLTLASVLGAAACEPEPQPPAPSVPRIDDVVSPTNVARAVVRGTKQSATALLINGDVVLPLSDTVSFAVELDLNEGDNVLRLQCEDALGRQSGPATVSIVVDTTAPDPPTLAAIPTSTLRDTVTVTGQKPLGARLFFDGTEITSVVTDASFSVQVPLELGLRTIRAATMDDLENESAVVTAAIERFDALPFVWTSPADTSVSTTADVALTGTRGADVVVEVNGVALAADDGTGAWTSDLTLTEGDNTVTVRAYFPGEEDLAVEQTRVLRFHPIPNAPVLDPAPARSGATVTITGSKPANTSIERDGVEIVALGPETTFTDDAPLAAEGANTLSYVAVSMYGQPSAPATVDVVRDTTPPTLALDPTLDGSLVGDVVAIAGTASDDDPALTVEVCVGACAADTDYTTVTLQNGVFDAVEDLAARVDLADGALATVHVRATDSLGLVTSATASVLLSRAPVSTGVASADAIALAAHGDPFAVTLAVRTGGAVVLAQSAGVPWALPASTAVSDIASAAVGGPRLSGDETGWVAWTEASARTASADTTRGALAARFDDTGAAAPLVVTDASGGDVIAIDVVRLSDGEAAVAYVVNDVVRVAISAGTAFGAPVDVSDASAVGITDVRVVADDNDALIVAWIETTARDGTLDDTDVVARRVDPVTGPEPTLAVVTATSGAFTDNGDDTLSLAALPGAAPADAAVLGVVNDAANGGEAWLFVLGGAQLDVTGRARIEPAGDALALELARDGDELLALVVDDGALADTAQSGAATPAVVALRGAPLSLGAPTLLSTAPASLPAAAAGHAAFFSGADVVVRALVESP